MAHYVNSSTFPEISCTFRLSFFFFATTIVRHETIPKRKVHLLYPLTSGASCFAGCRNFVVLLLNNYLLFHIET